jgi:hypothetical protein
MIRNALKGGETTPKLASRITVYALSKALAISPLEVYKMPAEMVKEMLMIHGNFEQLKAEEMEKEMKKTNTSSIPKSRLR